jgi:hypothetical protein
MERFINRSMMLMLAAALLFTAGCTHEMQVTNLSTYVLPKNEVPASGTFDVAVTAYKGTYQDQPFFDAVVAGLKSNSQIRLIRTNWMADTKELGFDPAYLITIDVKPRFEGDKANFWTTWPGCYIFACSWGGFQYHCMVYTTVTIVPMPDKQAVDKLAKPATKDVPTNFDFKHCNFTRGFWSGTGWWFPGFGLHNIVTGLFFRDYEKQATEPFHTAVDATYGNFIANEIVKLCRDQKANTAEAKNTGN